MSGIEFEEYLLAHFQKLGYKGKLTSTTNDYGADLVVRRKRERIVIQAKRYISKVGIKAIQEIVSVLYYNATKAIVVTNSYFTKNARELSRVNNVELWDRSKLIKVFYD